MTVSMLNKIIFLSILILALLSVRAHAIDCSFQDLSYKSLEGIEKFRHKICTGNSEVVVSQKCHENVNECEKTIGKKFRNRLRGKAYAQMQSPVALLCENMRGHPLFLTYQEGERTKQSHVCDFDNHTLILSDNFLVEFTKNISKK